MSEHGQPGSNPMDAAMAFWKEAMARFAPAAPAGAAHAAVPGADPAAWLPTPEMVRRMQGAFLDAMAQASEQYMRSPEFLAAMKSSLDEALKLRREMESYLQKNMGEAFRADAAAASGGSQAAVVAAIHELESRLTARLDDVAARLDRLEHAGPARPAKSGAGRSTDQGRSHSGGKKKSASARRGSP